MTKEEKQLLLKDICERLPYGVKLKTPKGDGHLNEITLSMFGTNVGVNIQATIREYLPLKDCKHYLRPMSSMTEEEKIEFSKLLVKRYCEEDWEGHISTSYCIEIDNVYTDDANGVKYPSPFSMDAIDWLNANHFDYRGLIEKGLALEAPEGMYS